jgi:hypothetical protein
MRRSTTEKRVSLALLLFAVGVALPAAAQNIPGAIYTSLQSGTTVNANLFPSKESVYLNGGPQNEHGQGLNDGLYYFAVTDPSGTILLSTDAVTCRQLVVAGGAVAGVPAGSPPASCTTGHHVNGSFNPANGSTPVQLIPYNDTPNNGHVYKVWLTPVADYDPAACPGKNPGAPDDFAGFCNDKSKTDNFKVNSDAAYVSVCKFNDLDGDGHRNQGEPLIAHWPITATGVDGGIVNTQTNDDGCVTLPVTEFDADGNQAVTLAEGTWGPDWSRTAPEDGASGIFTISGGVVALTIRSTQNITAPDFGNHNAFCGTSCPLDGLVVTKTADPAFTRSYTWNIEKDVDASQIKTAGSATFNYTVTVAHDAGTDSDFSVSGTIRVSNPGSAPIAGVNVIDGLNNGGICTVAGGTGLTVDAGSHVDLAYACGGFGTTLPADGINTATASAPGVPDANGTASVLFSKTTPTIVDGAVTVGDSLKGTLGTVLYSDPSPTAFTYAINFGSDPAGTCTSHDNTATLTTNTTGTTASASESVEVCVGADLTVSKTAAASYGSSIEKLVDRTLIQQAGGSAIFAYTVKVAEKDWAVAGNITVVNPNDWESIGGSLGDLLDIAASCSVSGGSAFTLAPSGSLTRAYSCSFSGAPSAAAGTNTATASWNKATAFTPNGSGAGTATFGFSSLTVTDTFNGATTTLGTVAGNVASKTFTYTRTVANAAAGQCLTYPNTAAMTETGQSSSKSIAICNTATGALTMGFWQNKNGQGLLTGGTSTAGICNSGTFLRTFAPFADLPATATCSEVASYVTKVIKAASASGAAMNPMLKGQMLATALDVFFSSAAGGGAIGSGPIGSVLIDLTKVNKPIGSANYENTSAAFGPAGTLTVLQLLTYAGSQANAGGTNWYGQVKAVQELAKDTFDAINNQVAYIAP